MNLLDDLRVLLSEREQHSTAIALIDEQLEKARRALGTISLVADAQSLTLPSGRGRRLNGPTAPIQGAILEALATSPQTIAELAATIDYPVLRVQAAMNSLRTKERVIREKGLSAIGGRWAYIYALPGTSIAVQQAPHKADEEAAAAIEAASG